MTAVRVFLHNNKQLHAEEKTGGLPGFLSNAFGSLSLVRLVSPSVQQVSVADGSIDYHMQTFEVIFKRRGVPSMSTVQKPATE